jgi:arginyl-tRNA synthetase
VETPLTQLRAAVQAASGAIAGGNGSARTPPTLERPKKAGFGDYATNAAMLLAPRAGAPPRDVAARLAEELGTRLGPALDRVDVAGPGFLNLFLSDAWCVQALDHVLAAGGDYGGGGATEAERINIEFVSANPTGPMTAASGRHGAYGDALARLLAFSGHDVGREYYFNDAGTQIEKLGASILARARGEEVPEGGYEGDYVRELAAEIPGAAELDASELARIGVERMFERIKTVLKTYRVEFDVFFSEAQLHEGEPTQIAAAL